ncbi:hypothetical protein QVD17_27839 [Tagetes erecta]|uniref:Uncharacterized protein n=1 Tax=Tagetes erecta TaxID=13708 RepID=A0AAD8K9Y8_TARER|nr:hypothetical protein QVD17_27839 [Tagetes erecta]
MVSKGRKFTYASKNGRKLSRIDRILTCSDFINQWSDACYTALPRYISDHAPLILTTIPQDFGPIPFRVFNSWMSKPDFESLIIKANDEFSFNGPIELAFQEKLKFFKTKIKAWVKDMKLKDEEQKDIFLKEMDELDKIMEVRLLSEEEEWALGECKNGLSELEAHHMKDLWQKSRSKWASYGDENTKYFHGIINVKNSRNRIHGVDVNGQWIQNPRIIKRE